MRLLRLLLMQNVLHMYKTMHNQNTDHVFKVTLHMTPSQWNSMSQWSASIPESPWLCMMHETNKNAEYAQSKEDTVPYRTHPGAQISGILNVTPGNPGPCK